MSNDDNDKVRETGRKKSVKSVTVLRYSHYKENRPHPVEKGLSQYTGNLNIIWLSRKLHKRKGNHLELLLHQQ